MAELRRNFAQGKMNKDLDERLVPEGQYRDANNIQIATSDGANVGAAQTLLGNTLHSTMDSRHGVYSIPTTAEVVGSIACPEKDKIYYFVAGGRNNQTGSLLDIRKDYIMEYDPVTETHKYVFVDIYSVKVTTAVAVSGSAFINIPKGSDQTTASGTTVSSAANNLTGVRIGMMVRGNFNGVTITESDNITVKDIIYHAGTESYRVYLDKDGADYSATTANGNVITFYARRVLQFNYNTLITGINVVDDFIFWTDNISEPKRVNIRRSISGTGGTEYLNGGGIAGYASANTDQTHLPFNGDTPFFHTRLTRGSESVIVPQTAPMSPSDYFVITLADNKRAVWVNESHVTVIRRSPTQPLELKMYRTVIPRVGENGAESNFYSTQSLNLGDNIAGDIRELTVNDPVDWRVNDVIVFSSGTSVDEYSANAIYNAAEDVDARAKIIESPVTTPDSMATGTFKIRFLSVSQDDDLDASIKYLIRLDSGDGFFEFKFPRFSYRYRYQDGEYSTFAPWSQVAFLPGPFHYEPNRGYNLGMVNRLRSLKLTQYFHQELNRPHDIVAIDILYKETNKPEVYTVKTLKAGSSGKYDGVWPNQDLNISARGEFTITTDQIHAVVPSNQLLRPYDNVPRKALAQEISANRLIYGNYLHNYTVSGQFPLALGIHSETIQTRRDKDDNTGKDGDVTVRGGAAQRSGRFDANAILGDLTGFAYPSVKSMRHYQVGVVFSDEYGRETPVITSNYATVKVPKDLSAHRNRLSVSFRGNPIMPSWAHYYSFYVKETSVEYYTLASDRWYNAIDGNIWLSFPSSERNKLDMESFISLKKAHGSNTPVFEKVKCKVLAIENEAPDDIRTTKKSLGQFFNTGNDKIGNLTHGYPLVDVTYVLVAEGAFTDVFGAGFEVSTPERMSIRFYGNGTQSEEYEVSRVSKITDYYKIKLAGSFGPDITFASTNGSYSGAIDNLSFNLFSKQVEKLPEFDGRFFVKIYRDPSILQHLGAFNEAAQEEIVSASWSLRYLNNNGYGNAGTHSDVDDPFETSDFHGVIGSEPAEQGSTHINGQEVEGNDITIANASHPTEYPWSTWSTAYGPDNEFPAIPNFGNDQSEYQWAQSYDGEEVGSVSHADINDDVFCINDGADKNGQKFWSYVAGLETFFIDGCTAYSWTGKDGRYGEDRPGNQYADDIMSNGGCAENAGNNNNPGGYFNGDAQPSNFKYDRGQPSRAIWGHDLEADTSVMDISWSGMGTGFREGSGSGSWNSQAPFKYQLSEISAENPGSIYEVAWSFMSILCQPGTRFRFQNDPDLTVYTVQDFSNFSVGGRVLGYNNTNPLTEGSYEEVLESGIWKGGTDYFTGACGIRNYKTKGMQSNKEQWRGNNMRQRWSIMVSPMIGSRGLGYNPIHGVKPELLDTELGFNDPRFRRALKHDLGDTDVIQIMIPGGVNENAIDHHYSDNPSIWETIPKESVDLDIYYQASPLIPITLNDFTREEYIPIGSTFEIEAYTEADGEQKQTNVHTVTGWDTTTNPGETKVTFDPAIGYITSTADETAAPDLAPEYGGSYADDPQIEFTKRNHYSLTAHVNGAITQGITSFLLHGGVQPSADSQKLRSQTHILDWNNCWTFGNGVESDRIRDDFNAPQMDNGVKASSVIAGPVKHERRKHGMIWSGIYNSNTGINNTNQFIMAESITKDLNPVNGSIQKLVNRNTRLITFCEDKVLRAVTNRDALYNADGNPQLVASNAVVGDVTPYQGNYGVSTNPESVVATPYQLYFTDAKRGHVLALSGEGVRSISDKGMRDYFADLMAQNTHRMIGTYDVKKAEYNLTVLKKVKRDDHGYLADSATISYNEISDGWVSFKSFQPVGGQSINNNYYTFYNGQIYKHHDNTTRNNFYGAQYTSDVTLLFNDTPESVKHFFAVNYEGTEPRITQFATEDAHITGTTTDNWLTGDYSNNAGIEAGRTVTDGEYFNLSADTGWYVDNIMTNLQTSGNVEFKDKEGKYFGYIIGNTATLPTLDTSEFSVQGLGNATISHGDPTLGETFDFVVSGTPPDGYGDPDWD